MGKKKKDIKEDQSLKISVKVEDPNGVVRVSFPATQQDADMILKTVNDIRAKVWNQTV